LEKIGRNYVEQLQTTLETMRRRCLELYDYGEHLTTGLGNRLEYVREWADDAFKSVKEDGQFKQQLIADIYEQKPLDSEDKKKRNTVQELYFGLSILMMALGAGQLTGLLWSASILSNLFSPLVELALVLLLPSYAYLKLKKNFHGYDDAERRDWLYAFVFCTSVLLGNLFGYRLLATTPCVFFLPPFVFAMVTDIELCPKTLYRSRSRVLAIALGISFLSMQALSFVTGMHSAVSTLAILAHCVLTAFHFQVIMGEGTVNRMKLISDKFPVSEAQILYVSAIVLLQLPISLFASSVAQ